MFKNNIKLLAILSIFLTGCGDIKAHKTFTKIGNVEIHNFDELYSYVGLSKDTSQTNKIRVCCTAYSEDLKNTYRYITILFKHTGTAWGGSSSVGRVNIDLCKNGIPPEKDAENEKKQVSIFPEFDSISNSTTVIVIPTILKKLGMLDENNKTKDDICIYPGDNLPFGTMREKDWFIVTKAEMDSAIEEY